MKVHVEPSHNASLKLGGGDLLHDGKVHKAKHHLQLQHSSPRKEEDNAEMKEYLNKLQELVPCMPKDKKLSKLEVITYVIDYIQDLSETLGLPPSPSSLASSSDEEEDDDEDFDMERERQAEISSKLTFSLINHNTSNFPSNEDSKVVSSRKPLSLIPNPDNKAVEDRQ